MLSLLFTICMFWVFGKLLWFGIKAAWGISKILLMVVFFPLILVGMALGGMIYLAFIILLIIGVAEIFF